MYFLVVVLKERRNYSLEKCRVTSYLVDQSKPWNVGVMNWQRLELTDMQRKLFYNALMFVCAPVFNGILFSTRTFITKKYVVIFSLLLFCPIFCYLLL